MKKPERKYYLLRDRGYIFANTISEENSLYWMSFLCGALADYPFYIQIKENEFTEVWNEELDIKELRERYSDTFMTMKESEQIEQEFGIEDAITKHKMPPAMEQMFVKSEIEIEGANKAD